VFSTTVETALARIRCRRGPGGTRGIVPGLIVADPHPGWIPASALLSGERVDELLDAAKQRWGASPPAAAALAWRSYTYWLTLPSVLSWATTRRVPLVDPDDLLVRLSVSHDQPLLMFGVRRGGLAALPDDPVAVESGVMIITSQEELLRQLRVTLREVHLDPLLERIQDRVRLGTRTLLGSLASAVGHAVVRGLEGTADELRLTADTLLSTLGVAGLLELAPGRDGTELVVRRRTCCLAFTLPEPKLCSGCCIPAGWSG
jgi:ferric iron reductase protein FhuF